MGMGNGHSWDGMRMLPEGFRHGNATISDFANIAKSECQEEQPAMFGMDGCLRPVMTVEAWRKLYLKSPVDDAMSRSSCHYPFSLFFLFIPSTRSQSLSFELHCPGEFFDDTEKNARPSGWSSQSLLTRMENVVSRRLYVSRFLFLSAMPFCLI